MANDPITVDGWSLFSRTYWVEQTTVARATEPTQNHYGHVERPRNVDTANGFGIGSKKLCPW